MDLNCSTSVCQVRPLLKAAVLNTVLLSRLGNQNFCFFLKQGVSLGKKRVRLFILFSDILSPQFAEMISALDLKCLNTNALK